MVTEAELVELLREEYWHMSTTGAQAMSNFWAEMADNKSGFEETAAELGVTLQDFARAASLLAEWLSINDLMYKSPMEQSVEIRTEKLKFPEGPQ